MPLLWDEASEARDRWRPVGEGPYGLDLENSRSAVLEINFLDKIGPPMFSTRQTHVGEKYEPMESMIALIRHLRADVPYYHDCGPDFHELPVLRRRDLIANWKAFISLSHNVDVEELVEFKNSLTGTGPDVAFRSNILVERTSGSSGLPLVIPKTKEERIISGQSIWRCRRRYDPDVNSRNYLPLVNTAFAASKVSFRYDNPSACRPFWEYIAANCVRWIHATPLLLRQITNAATTRCTSDALCVAESTGQILGVNDCDLIQQKLGIRLVNQYACKEVWAIGYSLGTIDFEVIADNVYVEIVDDQDQPVVDRMEGRVIVTSRHQRLFPLVRYDTGDCGQLYIDESGRRRLILSPHRPHEMLLNTDPPRSGTAIFKRILKRVYAELGHVEISYLQVFQKTPHCFVVLIQNTPYAERIRSLLEHHFNRSHIIANAKFELLLCSRSDVEAAQGAPKFSLFTNISPSLATRVADRSEPSV